MTSTNSQNTDRRGIISAGTWAIDRIKIIDQWPREEHLARITATDQQGGGCGYNLGVDIRKLDCTMPVEAIGLAGNDTDGKFLLDLATSVGIDITQLRQIEGVQTSFTDVFVAADTARRTFFHHTGSSDHITPDHFNLEKCRGRILHLGLLGVHALMDSAWKTDPNGWVTVLKSARLQGIHTNLELVSIAKDRIREIALPCIEHIDSLIVNEYELSALADSELCMLENTIDESLFTTAAKKLFKTSKNTNGALKLIVAHCPAVAFAMTADGTVFSMPSFAIDSAHVISAVGAGDAFAAGMLYSIHENHDINSALELAHATAAASLRSATTVGAVESVERCLAFARGSSTTV